MVVVVEVVAISITVRVVADISRGRRSNSITNAHRSSTTSNSSNNNSNRRMISSTASRAAVWSCRRALLASSVWMALR
jgi:hypothetical protein